MATTANTLDTQELESCVKEMYREVAESPEKRFHFELGRGASSHGLEAATRERGRLWELVSFERSTRQT